MRRILASAAVLAAALSGFAGSSNANAICAANLICGLQPTCTGIVNVCPNATSCSGGISANVCGNAGSCSGSISVNVCSNAGTCSGTVNVCIDAGSCSGGINICNFRVTR